MKELNPTEIWGPHDEYAGEMPRLEATLRGTPGFWDTPSHVKRKPRRITIDRVLLLVAVVLSVASLVTALTHRGPRGYRGPQGTTGPAGATGAQGPAAPDPYGYICTMTNVPFNGVLRTAYLPCSQNDPDNP